jgi:hypothetical protein
MLSSPAADSDAEFAPLLIIVMVDADQLFAVMFEEILCAFLTESQYLPSLHKRAS